MQKFEPRLVMMNDKLVRGQAVRFTSHGGKRNNPNIRLLSAGVQDSLRTENQQKGDGGFHRTTRQGRQT